MTEHQEETITYGAGRFVIDIPASMQFSGIYSLQGREIKETLLAEDESDQHTLTEWQSHLQRIYQTKPPRGRDNALIDAVEITGIGQWCKASLYYHDPEDFEFGSFDLLCHQGTTCVWIKAWDKKLAAKDIVYEISTDLARAYRPPTEGEERVAVLPDKDAFYLRCGAIDLPFEYEEGVDIVFRGHPLDSGLSLEIETNVVQEVYSAGLLERFAAAIATNYAPGVKVEKVRAGKRTVAGLKGEELIVRGTEDGKTAFNFQWDYPGRENDSHHPRLGLMMDSKDGRLEEKLALWDAVLNSLRPAGR